MSQEIDPQEVLNSLRDLQHNEARIEDNSPANFSMPMNFAQVDAAAHAPLSKFQSLLGARNNEMRALAYAAQAEVDQKVEVMKRLNAAADGKLKQKATKSEDLNIWSQKLLGGYWGKLNWKKSIRSSLESNLKIPGPNRLPEAWKEAYEELESSICNPSASIEPLIASLLATKGKVWSQSGLAPIISSMLFITYLTQILIRDGAALVEDVPEIPVEEPKEVKPKKVTKKRGRKPAKKTGSTE